MKVRDTKKQFVQVLKKRGLKLSSLSPEEGIDAIIAFYKDVRADGCDLKQQGDMLLYQWGNYDWGVGESFEFDITRQLIEGDGEDENIRQLNLTFHFKPTDSLHKLKNGNRWCRSPKMLKSFQSFVKSSGPFKAVAATKPAEVSLEFGIAG
jgi:hypothetical protein